MVFSTIKLMLGWYLFYNVSLQSRRERAFVIVGEDDDGMAVIENPFWLVIEDMGMILKLPFCWVWCAKKVSKNRTIALSCLSIFIFYNLLSIRI